MIPPVISKGRGKGSGRGRGKSVDFSTPWSDWQWDAANARFYRVRRDHTGECEYELDSNLPRSSSTHYYESNSTTTFQQVPDTPSQQSNPLEVSSGYRTSGQSYPQSKSSYASGTYDSDFEDAFIPPTQSHSGTSYTASSYPSSADASSSFYSPTSTMQSYNPTSSSAMGYQTSPAPSSNSYSSAGHGSMGLPAVRNTPYTPTDSIDVLANKFGQASILGSASTNVSPYGSQVVAVNNTNSQIEKLDPRYVFIENGSRFFQVGRIFKVLWAEPAGVTPFGSSETVHTIQYGEKVHSKIRPFVVITKHNGHSSCLPLTTHHGQGSSKQGLNPDDFVAVYDEKIGRPQYSPGEKLTKKAIPVVVEDPSEKIDPMTRVNITRIYSVEHNLKVKKVGRVHEKHISRLLQFVDEAWMANRSS